MASDKSSSLGGGSSPLVVVGHMMTQPRMLISFVVISMVCAGLLFPAAMPAAQVEVRYREGLVHGFLVLSTLEGEPLADGDLIVRFVALFHAEVVIEEIDVQIGIDQLFLDQLPNDASHLVAVELDHWIRNLDSSHEMRAPLWPPPNRPPYAGKGREG